MRSRVFLIAGGSGGHLFPAISLRESDKTFDYYFLIDHRIEKIIIKKKLKYFKRRIVETRLQTYTYFKKVYQ